MEDVIELFFDCSIDLILGSIFIGMLIYSLSLICGGVYYV